MYGRRRSVSYTPSGRLDGNDNRQANTFRNPNFWDVNTAEPYHPYQPINPSGVPYGLKLADPRPIDPITKRFLLGQKTQSKITK